MALRDDEDEDDLRSWIAYLLAAVVVEFTLAIAKEAGAWAWRRILAWFEDDEDDDEDDEDDEDDDEDEERRRLADELNARFESDVEGN